MMNMATVGMERTLSVLDYAILVVSGVEGVQSHTITLIRLFELYDIPCFVFVNKLDMQGASFEGTIQDLKKYLPGAVDMTSLIGSDPEGDLPESITEEVAALSEDLMEEFFGNGSLKMSSVRTAVRNREVTPVVGGSALKMAGVRELLNLIGLMAEGRTYPDEFGARVYKITRDNRGNRLTHLKVTGGVLRNKMLVRTGTEDDLDEDTGKNSVRPCNIPNKSASSQVIYYAVSKVLPQSS